MTARNRIPCHVAPSSIHGKGLFASRDIAAGETLGAYRGRRWSKSLDIENDHVVYRMLDGRVKDARLGTTDLRFINHSTESNVEMEWSTWEFFALRAITAGEEILWNYGEDWEESDSSEKEV